MLIFNSHNEEWLNRPNQNLWTLAGSFCPCYMFFVLFEKGVVRDGFCFSYYCLLIFQDVMCLAEDTCGEISNCFVAPFLVEGREGVPMLGYAASDYT